MDTSYIFKVIKEITLHCIHGTSLSVALAEYIWYDTLD